MASSQVTASPDRCAAIYVRRSSRKDLGLNRSLMEQEADCRALAERFGLDVVRLYSEREGTGASNRSRKARPQWEAALADLDKGGDFHTLIVWSLDRADRRGADTLAGLLTRHAASGRRIIACDGTDTSDERQRLSIIIRGEIAREEAENTAKRVARTKATRRADGRWLGGRPPYGLQIVDGHVEPDPETAPIARRIAEEALAGRSLWEIVQGLNADGIATARGGQWRTNTLSQLVRSPAFAGLQSVRERTASGGWRAVAEVYRDPETRDPVTIGEGIITPTERALIMRRLADRSAERARGQVRGRKGSKALLGPIARCRTCGRRSALSSGGTTGSYRCASLAAGNPCERPFSAPRGGLDDYVTGRFLSYLATLEPDDERLVAIAERWTAHVDPASDVERRAAQAALDAVDADLARARRLAVAGILTEDEAAVELRRLRSHRAKAAEELAALPTGTLDVAPLLDLAQSREAWDALPLDERRELLPLAIDEVRVGPAKGRGYRFTPEERVTFVWAGEELERTNN
ncbi:recombinase family protein [Citricoccus sp. SGAir0253]|uniref:recombinase family protein n=1 Tax=Citricoccus sp. SGAir0253 TaxID=2567881 RepID=UPI0010CD3AF6|nr:recombinase family protein [Citricoccus sp. SGAir0253]QCU77254.1 recombinase family protein [Citricoccus sp. SGAir0253]